MALYRSLEKNKNQWGAMKNKERQRNIKKIYENIESREKQRRIKKIKGHKENPRQGKKTRQK